MSAILCRRGHKTPIGPPDEQGKSSMPIFCSTCGLKLKADRQLGDALGARLLRHRFALGVTQDQVAARLGVSFVAVGRWEDGRRNPSPEHLAQYMALRPEDF